MNAQIVKTGLATLFLSCFCTAGHGQTDCDGRQILQKGQQCTGDELDDNERALARLINDYRQQNGLPAIPLSPSLSLVANRHVRDMAINMKKLEHQWSNCPDWTDCMWEAPQRLGTPYPSHGYENAGRIGGALAVERFLEGWKDKGKVDQGHHDVMLNRNAWKDKTWRALGIGIYNGYGAMWVGVDVDPVKLDGGSTQTLNLSAAGPTNAPQPSRAAAAMAADDQGMAPRPRPSRAAPANAGGFEPGKRHYQLQTRFLEAQNMCLEGNAPGRDAFLGGAAYLDKCDRVSGQQWTFVPAGDGYFKLQTMQLAEQKMCLEGGRGAADASPAMLRPCRDETGQFWKVVPANDGYFKLQTMFLEARNLCLEGGRGADKNSAADQQPCKAVTGQLWKLSPH